MNHFIYFFLKNYNRIYLIYNILFWGIYILKRCKNIKDDWILI